MMNKVSPVDLVVDTSALLAILLPEEDGPQYYDRLRAARQPGLSSVGKVETLMVLMSRQPTTAQRLFAGLRQSLALRIMAVDDTLADLALSAFVDYGKRRHPAALNFGDCFSYALAKQCAVPLLYKGNDFSKTDIVNAMDH